MSDTVAQFAASVIAPRVRAMDEAETMDPAIVEQLFASGLMGIEIPESHGGAGMNFAAAVVAVEQLARADPSVSVLVDVHNTLVNTAILKYAGATVRDEWLPRLATRSVGCFCLSEPASGSDAFAMKTRATRTDAGYRISGSKMWITNAMEAEVFIVFANLDPDKGYKGITAFVVEKGTKGLEIAKKEKKLGIRASSTCVVNFDDVEIPKEQLLGKEGEGYKYAIGILNEGRIGIAAQMTGLALGAWENAARYEPSLRGFLNAIRTRHVKGLTSSAATSGTTASSSGSWSAASRACSTSWRRRGPRSRPRARSCTTRRARRRPASHSCRTRPWPSCTRRR